MLVRIHTSLSNPTVLLRFWLKSSIHWTFIEFVSLPSHQNYSFTSEIQYLHEINSTLKEEYDLQSNYENLSQKFKFLKKEEQDQVEKVRNLRKKKHFCGLFCSNVVTFNI